MWTLCMEAVLAVGDGFNKMEHSGVTRRASGSGSGVFFVYSVLPGTGSACRGRFVFCDFGQAVGQRGIQRGRSDFSTSGYHGRSFARLLLGFWVFTSLQFTLAFKI